MGRLLLICFLFCSVPAFAQESSSTATAPPSSAPEAVSREVAQAEAAIVKSDWKTAEPLLDSWLAAHPSDARALFDAGYVADATSRNEDAVSLYNRAVTADPKSFEAQISLGLLQARLGKLAESRPALEAAIHLDAGAAGPSAKAKAWRALAQIDFKGTQGKPDAAQASLDLLEALKLTPETTEDTLFAAALAEANQDAAAAEQTYRRLLTKDPDSTAAVAGLAHLLIAEKKYPEAEPLLQAAHTRAPKDAALTAQLAAVLVAEDKAEAVPLLKEFHEQNPHDPAITRMLAEVLADDGEFAESDLLYSALLASNPNDAALLAGHGQNLIRLHRYPEALKVFQASTEIDQTNGEAWNGLAFAAFETHQPTITLHALTVRSKYLPESATIYFLWATAYDTLHDKKKAAAYYHQFLESSGGKFPDQEWQARHRLALLEKTP